MSSLFEFIMPLVRGAKQARISDGLQEYSEKDRPFVAETAKELQGWAQKDWERFKTEVRPVGHGLTKVVAPAPDISGAEGRAAAGVASKRSAAQSGITYDPNSGAFVGANIALSGQAAGADAAAIAAARNSAINQDVARKTSLIGMMRPTNARSSVAGLELVSSAGKNYGKYSGQLAGQATKNFGRAAQGLTEWWSQDRNDSTKTEDEKQLQAEQNTEGGSWDYASGGIIRGPGTGNSDSIRAKIDGVQPAGLSDGEYEIPPETVRAVGLHNLEAMRMKHHKFGGRRGNIQ